MSDNDFLSLNPTIDESTLSVEEAVMLILGYGKPTIVDVEGEIFSYGIYDTLQTEQENAINELNYSKQLVAKFNKNNNVDTNKLSNLEQEINDKKIALDNIHKKIREVKDLKKDINDERNHILNGKESRLNIVQEPSWKYYKITRDSLIKWASSTLGITISKDGKVDQKNTAPATTELTNTQITLFLIAKELANLESKIRDKNKTAHSEIELINDNDKLKIESMSKFLMMDADLIGASTENAANSREQNTYLILFILAKSLAKRIQTARLMSIIEEDFNSTGKPLRIFKKSGAFNTAAVVRYLLPIIKNQENQKERALKQRLTRAIDLSKGPLLNKISEHSLQQALKTGGRKLAEFNLEPESLHFE